MIFARKQTDKSILFTANNATKIYEKEIEYVIFSK